MPPEVRDYSELLTKNSIALAAFRDAIRAIADDASPCATAGHSLVRDELIEAAMELVRKN